MLYDKKFLCLKCKIWSCLAMFSFSEKLKRTFLHAALQFLEKQEFTETTSDCRCANNMNTYKFNASLMVYMSGQLSSFYFFKLYFYHRTQILCRCGGSKFYIYQSYVPGYVCRCSSTGKLAGHQAIQWLLGLWTLQRAR